MDVYRVLEGVDSIAMANLADLLAPDRWLPRHSCVQVLEDGAAVGCWRKRQLIGFVSWVPRRDQKEWAIIHVIVHPDHRRRGIGTELVQAVLGRVGRRPHSPQEVRMLVRERHLDLQSLLRHCGMQATLVKTPFKHLPPHGPRFTEKATEDLYDFRWVGGAH